MRPPWLRPSQTAVVPLPEEGAVGRGKAPLLGYSSEEGGGERLWKEGSPRLVPHGGPCQPDSSGCRWTAEEAQLAWPHPLPPQQVDLQLRLEKRDMPTSVPGAAGAGEGPGSRRPPECKEDREERVLAMLGIVGTILNLLVIIFVYVYTTI